MLIDVVVVVLTFIYSSPHNAAPPVVTGGKQKIGKTHTPNTYVYVYISKSNNEINKQQFRIPDTKYIAPFFTAYPRVFTLTTLQIAGR